LLDRELDWKPAAHADPATFISNPFRYGRDWRLSGGCLLPAAIQEDRKFDSPDTPPNRFIKFALQTFRNLCESILSARRNGRLAFNPDDTVALEATAMLHSLDAFLALPIFDDVDELRRIPFESTTLQHREGYREILLAWLMLDAAAQLDWPGREDAYNGTTRDVATLYEYWLYFLLVRALSEKLGMVPDSDPLASVDGALPFCCRAEDGRLVINLQQGKDSYSCFTWRMGEQKLHIHFFYNRSFSRRGVTQRGTYSKQFRPDYTLVILPAGADKCNWHEAERRAEESGQIAYLHFDAKYRIETLEGVLGDSEPHSVVDEMERDREEARAKATSSAKNADLYKMHTYNDAIRRTVGSYVLYPGEDPADELGKNRFERYHEIIPGIGAFALRPNKDGLPPAGLDPVCDFIRDLITHQLDCFAQSYRINYWTHETIKDKPVRYAGTTDATSDGKTPPVDVPVAIGFIRAEAQAACLNRGLFYFHAVETDGRPTRFNQDVLQAKVLIPYGHKHWLGWYAPVTSCRLVSQSELKEKLSAHEEVIEGDTPFYFLMEFSTDSVRKFKDSPTLAVPPAGAPKLKKWADLFPLVESALPHVSHGT
jgi:hypothetical protein